MEIRQLNTLNSLYLIQETITEKNGKICLKYDNYGI